MLLLLLIIKMFIIIIILFTIKTQKNSVSIPKITKSTSCSSVWSSNPIKIWIFMFFFKKFCILHEDCSWFTKHENDIFEYVKLSQAMWFNTKNAVNRSCELLKKHINNFISIRLPFNFFLKRFYAQFKKHLKQNL